MKLEPDKFPIDRHLEDIANSVQHAPCVLVKAQTGAGKTTRLPPFLLGKTEGKILVLEPRRLAAKLSAERCAEILSERPGKTVGHHIRFDKTAGRETRLLFITEGLFLPYLRQDPKLSEFSTIILDEFHERSIHTDVALALTRLLQATTRPDLKLIVMSATLETEKLENYLGSPETFNIPGRAFPIDMEFHPPPSQGQGRRRAPAPWQEAASAAVLDLLSDPRSSLNILVFLPGMGEIKALEQKLNTVIDSNVEIVPLHSSLPKSQQNKAFKGEGRKVILSTNIAETSLTIPNVTGVVDMGTERPSSFAPWSGMPLLQLEKISKASATQRAGRAGRTQNGVVYRLYSEADFAGRPEFTPPEIKRVELSHYILDLLDLGVHPDQLDWLEPPDEKNLKTALDLLEFLGAIKDSEITPMGRYLAQLPLHPRLGAMLFECPKENLSDALLAACLINEGMILAKKVQFSEEDVEVCDLSLQLDLIKASYFKDPKLSDYHLSYLDQKKAARALELYQALAAKVGTSKDPLRKKTSHKDLILRLLKGFPDRVAAKRVASKGKRTIQSYNFCLGRGGTLATRSALSQNSPGFILVLDALEDPRANASIGTRIQAASKVDPALLVKSSSPFLAVEKETSFNEKKGTIALSTNTKYGKLTLSSETQAPVPAKGSVLATIMKKNWPWPFANDEALREYNQRVKLLDEAGIEHNCPALEGEMFELFLETSVEEDTSYQELLKTGLEELVFGQLSPQDSYVLDHEIPKELKLSNGKSFIVSYQEERPFIEARAQDLFSVREHPHIASGKIPLVVKVLSPANRVVQVVQDLPGFWKTSWSELRKEMKGRYPKHFWPEEPESAQPKRLARQD